MHGQEKISLAAVNLVPNFIVSKIVFFLKKNRPWEAKLQYDMCSILV